MSVRTDVVNLQVNIKGNQAQKDLGDLRKKAADIRFEMQNLKKGTQEYIDKGKELSAVTGKIDNLKKQIGLTSLTLKELRQEQTKLNALMSSTTPFSEEYKKYQEQLGNVNKRITEVKTGAQGFNAIFGQLGVSLKQFSLIAVAALGFEVLLKNLPQIIFANAKLSDQLADVQRVAGLTKGEVTDLYHQLQQIDTRTSTEGLLKIAVVAGKLGVAKNDILDFTKATDMLVVALGDELGDADQITTQLGKILNVFDGKVTGQNISELGNAIVDLANKGVASGAFIVDFTQRLSGLAKTSNLSLPSVIGFAAGLEETGARVESSSTAISKLINTIALDLPKAAKIAGATTQKEIDAFAKNFAEKPQEALLAYAAGLQKNKGSFAEIAASFKDAGEEGSRVVSVLATLGSKTDFFRQKIDDAAGSLTNTTEIENAFALKNSTLGAEMDKLGNRIKNAFTGGAIADFFRFLVKGINDIVTPTKTASDEFNKLNKEVQNLDKNISPLVKRYDELKAKTTLNKDEQIELKSIITQISAAIPSAVTQYDNLGNAIGISTKRVYDYIEAEKARLKVVNATAIDDYNAKLAEVNKNLEKQKTVVEQIAKTGTFRVASSASGGTGGASTFFRDATQAEIKEQQDKYKELVNEKLGYDTEIERLNGVAIQKQIDADKKAAEEAKKSGQGQKTQYQVDLGALQQQIDDYNAKLKSFQGTKKELSATLAARDQLQKQLDGLINKKTPEQRASDKKENSILKDQQKLKDDLIKIAQDLEVFNRSQYEKELTNANQKYDALQKLAHGNKDQLEDIERLRLKETLALQDKFLDDAFKHGDVKLDDYLSKTHDKFLKAVSTISPEQVKKIFDNLTEQLSDSAKKGLDNIKGSDQLDVDISSGKKRRDAILKQLDDERDIELSNTKLTEDEKAKIREKYRQRHASVIKDSFIADVDLIVQFAQGASQALNTVFQAEANIENARLARDKAVNDQKKANLDKQFKGRLISQAQYNNATAKLDADYDKKKRDIEVKQFKRNQKMQIAQALISGAQGALSVLAAVPGPIDILSLGAVRGIMLGITAAITAAEVAAIATQKVPEGRKGLIVNGPSHEDQGVDLVERKSGRRLANVEGGEPLLVLSRNTYKNNKGIVDQLIYNSMFRQGASIMPSFQKAYTPINAPQLVPIMKDGGIVNTHASVMQDDQGRMILLSMRNEIAELRNDMNGWNRDLQATVSLSDIKSKSSLLDAAKKASGIKQ